MKHINPRNSITVIAILVVLALLWYFKSSHKQETANKKSFDSFIHKLNVINPPFGGQDYMDKDYPPNKELNEEFSYFRNDSMDCYSIIGLLNDTSNFYAIAWYLGAGNVPPYISTFNKSGILLSEAQLYNEKYQGADPECSWTGYFSIDKNLNILLIDTVTERRADSNDYIPTRYYISKVIGKINKNGVVKYGKPLIFDLDIKDADKDMKK
ncbi:MAG: hypothetical protein WCL51_08420 [Bacteroidota bacterium]